MSEKSFFYALDSENPKRAKQILAKLLKKNPKSVHYQLLSNYYDLKVNYDYEQSFRKSLDLISDPLNYNQIPNGDVLTLALDIFIHSNHADEISKVYETLLKKQPLNSNLINHWFQYSLANLNISSLQKASFHLQKVNSSQGAAKNRTNVLIAAFNYYLASAQTKNALEKRLFPQLALKLLSAVEPLKSDQEIFVKVKLLIASNSKPAAIEILKKLLSGKKFNEVDLSLILIYVELLHDVQDFYQLYEFTNDVIFKFKFNDFNFWNYLLLSGFKANKQDELLNKIQNHFLVAGKEQYSRNLLLALINYGFLAVNVSLAKQHITKYFELYGSKKSAFVDLVRYVKKFADVNGNSDLGKWFINEVLVQKVYEQELGFPEKLKQASTEENNLTIQEVTKLVNIRKFIFLQREEEFFAQGSPNGREVQTFVEENIQLYNYCFNHYLIYNKELLKNDYFIGNELLLINLQVLLTTNFSVQAVIEQVIILKYLLSISPSDFLVKVWLMKLYNYLNLPELTAEIFDSLSIKNVQIDTLNHYLSSRISTRFPDPKFIEDHIVRKLTNFYENEHSYLYLVHFLDQCYENASYTKIEKNFEFLNKLRASFEKFYDYYETLISYNNTNNTIKAGEFKKRTFEYRNLIKLYHLNNKSLTNQQNAKSNASSVTNESILLFNTTGELNSSPIDFDATVDYSDHRDLTTGWNVSTAHVIPQLESQLAVGVSKDNSSDYLKLQNLKFLILNTVTISKENQFLKNFINLFKAYPKELLTKAEYLELQLYLSFWEYVLTGSEKCGKNSHLSPVNETLQSIISLFSETISNNDGAFSIDWKFSHQYILIVSLYKSFSKNYKYYKQQHPHLFQTSSNRTNEDPISKFASLLNTFKKTIDTVHDKNQLKKIKAQNDQFVSSFHDELNSKSGDLFRSLNVKQNTVSEVFKSLQNGYQKTFNLLKKI